MGGGRMGLPIGVGGGGLGIVGVIIAILFATGVSGRRGGRPIPGIELPGMPAADGSGIEGPDLDARLVDFMGFVVDDVQDSWRRTFANAEQPYEETDLVIFEQATPTAWGREAPRPARSTVPRTRWFTRPRILRELRNRFGAPGDFAQAYVIAHEFGHHVQNVLGISDEVRRLQQENQTRRTSTRSSRAPGRLPRRRLGALGVPGEPARARRPQGGPGSGGGGWRRRIQEQATGRIDQESWTHGSSEQRTEWFRRGYEAGDPNACDTFST